MEKLSGIKTVVVKCGGTRGVDLDAVSEDVAWLVGQGIRVAVVHGGSEDIERLSRLLGVRQRMHVAPDGVSSRYTDQRTLEIVTMALAGAVKPRLVGCLVTKGVPAIGLTGLDCALLLARRKKVQRALVDSRVVLVRDNHSGLIESVDTRLLHDLLDSGRVPVLSPPAITSEGHPVNIDADRVAAAIAAALDGDVLVLLTAAGGLQRDAADEGSVLPVYEVPRHGRPAEWAQGGMALKLIAAREALDGGTGRVVVADGRIRRPVRHALAGNGTEVVMDADDAAGTSNAGVRA